MLLFSLWWCSVVENYNQISWQLKSGSSEQEVDSTITHCFMLSFNVSDHCGEPRSLRRPAWGAFVAMSKFYSDLLLLRLWELSCKVLLSLTCAVQLGWKKLYIIVKSLCCVQLHANGTFPGSRMSAVRHHLRGIFLLLRSEDFACKQKLRTTHSMAGVFPYT